MGRVYFNFQNSLISILILSGILSAFINAYYIKFDFTLFVLLIVSIDILYNVFKNNVRINKLYLFILTLIFIFYAYIIASLLYSPSPRYKYVKTFFFIVNIIFFIYPVFVKKIDYEKILKIVKYTSIFLSLIFIYQRYNYWLPENGGINFCCCSYFNVSL